MERIRLHFYSSIVLGGRLFVGRLFVRRLFDGRLFVRRLFVVRLFGGRLFGGRVFGGCYAIDVVVLHNKIVVIWGG